MISVNFTYAQSSDDLNAQCDFPTGKYAKKLSDITTFKSIEVDVNNHRKWVKNGLAILKTGKDHTHRSFLTFDENNQIEIKSDKEGNVGTSIGKKSFPDNKIKENFDSLIQTIFKEKPKGIKGDFILSAFLTSSMGVSYKLKVEK